MNLKIMHLSDLHIGKAGETLSDAKRALKELCARISMATEKYPVNCVVVTGDILDGKIFSETTPEVRNKFIELAVEFFKDLTTKLAWFESNLKNRTLFIPGNHEVDRNNGTDRFHFYKEFLAKFYAPEEIPECYDQTHWHVVRPFEKEKVLFIGYNSANFYQLDKDGRDYGEIGAEQMDSVHSSIRKVELRDSYTKVALLHHHFYNIESGNKSVPDRSCLRDCESFMRELEKHDVSISLHGHTHTSMHRRVISTFKLTEPDKIVTVLGCGTTANPTVIYNDFNVVEVFPPDEAKDLRFTPFSYRGSTFEPGVSVLLPLKTGAKSKIKILDALDGFSALSRGYRELRNIDNDTASEDLLGIFDKTVGMLGETAAKLEDDSQYLLHLLFAAHYRFSVLSKNEIFRSNMMRFFEENCDHNLRVDKKQGMIDLLALPSLSSMHQAYKKLREDSTDKEKRYLSFVIIAAFLTEVYFTLTRGSEEFFGQCIKSKADINFKPGEIRSNIEGGTIIFETDDERRALGISVVSKNATAHKVMTLIIKEFERVLGKYEEDLAAVGFKIFYIVPKITKVIENTRVALESFNFGAYIPNLIPLLAGESIYDRPEVFSRELIQNSIDAINLRKKLDSKFKDSGLVKIEIGVEDGLQYFEITDNGIGMTKYVLERYFTSIGRSFYRSEDFTELKTDYNPISQFGIGFLSCFLVGKRVDVKTKYYKAVEGEERSYRLSIPNYDGCFFIEGAGVTHVGTVLRVYENEEKRDTTPFDADEIISFIKNRMLNVEYDIQISYQGKSLKIPKNNMLKELIQSTSRYGLLFFIPLDEGKHDITLRQAQSIFKSFSAESGERYGIFLYKRDNEIYNAGKFIVSNAGILVNNSDYVYGLTNYKSMLDVYVNIPSEKIELDVSRDKIKSINSDIEKILKEEIGVRIKKQKKEYVSICKNNYVPSFILSRLGQEDFRDYEKVGDFAYAGDGRLIVTSNTANFSSTLKIIDDIVFDRAIFEFFKSSYEDYDEEMLYSASLYQLSQNFKVSEPNSINIKDLEKECKDRLGYFLSVLAGEINVIKIRDKKLEDIKNGKDSSSYETGLFSLYRNLDRVSHYDWGGLRGFFLELSITMTRDRVYRMNLESVREDLIGNKISPALLYLYGFIELLSSKDWKKRNLSTIIKDFENMHKKIVFVTSLFFSQEQISKGVVMDLNEVLPMDIHTAKRK